MPGLELRHLSRVFHDGKSKKTVTALDELSLTFESGSLTSVIGPIGSGKTTLLRLIAGLDQPEKGDILWNDSPLPSDLKKRAEPLSFQPHEHALYPHLTIRENLLLATGWKKLSKADINERLDEILTEFSLEEHLNKHPDQLSAGQCQTAALARVLMLRSPLLLLDEPLSHGDRESRHRHIKALRRLCKKHNTTLIAVTHHQEEAFALSEKIVLLDQGRLIQHDSPLDIYHQPNSLFASQFIGRFPMNVLHGDIEVANGSASFKPAGSETAWPIETNETLSSQSGIHLAIRPEHIVLRETKDAGLAIEEESYLGDGSLIRLSEQNLQAFVPVVPSAGQLSPVLRPHRICILPSA